MPMGVTARSERKKKKKQKKESPRGKNPFRYQDKGPLNESEFNHLKKIGIIKKNTKWNEWKKNTGGC